MLHQDSGWIGKSIPSALEISLGHGFCTPRPSGFPSGFALGKSLGSRGAKPMTAGNLSRFPSTLEISLGLRPREISRVSGNLGRRGWISQSIPRLGGARIHSLIISRKGLPLKTFSQSFPADREGFLDPLPVEKFMRRERPSSTKTRQ